MATNEQLISYLKEQDSIEPIIFENGMKHYAKKGGKDLALFLDFKKRMDNLYKYFEGLQSSLKGQSSINSKNKVPLLKFLANSGMCHFPFIEFANILNRDSNGIDSEELFKVIDKLQLSIKAPLYSFPRFEESYVYFTPTTQALDGFLHPMLESQVIYETKGKGLELNLLKTGKVVSFQDNPNDFKKILSEVINEFHAYLDGLRDKEGLDEEEHYMEINQYKMQLAFSNTDSFNHTHAKDGLFQNTFYSLAKVDLLRWLQVFGDNFFIKRLGKCDWCGRYFIISDTRSKHCSESCSKKKYNQ